MRSGIFRPAKEFKKSRQYQEAPSVFNSARKNPQAFWAKAAKELHWFKPWKKVLEWKSPWAKWFIGGKLNASYNCLDRHVNSGRKNKAAIIWEGEPGDERVLTYRDVWREVNKFANVLKKLGVKKGDRVCLYMGMIPELVIAMHACNRIGAPHSVVFGGFSAEALRGRINDAEAKVLDHRRRRLPSGRSCAVEKECRRGAYRYAFDRACRRSEACRLKVRRADEGRPRSVVG